MHLPVELESALADPWARLHSKATHGLVATQFHLVHGDTVQVKGKILSDAKAFVVNLGQDRDNLILHFNPRFDFQTDANTIVCNSLHNGVWGKEERLTDFPFEQRGKVKLSFTFLSSEIKMSLAEGHVFSFPNRLGLKTIGYIAVEGDFKIRVLKFL
ncbi:16 kDa beta-galactoside-binding lectin-like isoform X3 [Rhineura floridana]|uniref:16 kDa beta-galactoside-binding lectin-like isoform X3 n=1 Tax=Rhineura floridana TaxID=261503 RepID=UPI002AC824D0|nr:16 kDa beta-galactoside-binding lectin-like isoform X3 [Rhineura floridana]